MARLEDIHEADNGFITYTDGLFVHKNKANTNCCSFQPHKDSYCLNSENICQERLEPIIRLDTECKKLQQRQQHVI